MNLSEQFAIKFMNSQFKSLKKGFISTSYNWLIDSKYREYMELNKWLNKQFNLCIKSDLFLDYYFDCIDKIPFNHQTQPDKVIVHLLKYVNTTIKYLSDELNFGYIENWEDLTETIKRGKGDCENQNSLVYVMARVYGLPKFLLWNCTGVTTTGEGHFWLLYFSIQKNSFFSIDSTYRVDKSYIEYRQPFKLGRDYRTIWYLFNQNHVFKPR